MAENLTHYCMLLTPEGSEGSSRAASLDAFKWDRGARITATFMEGDVALRQRVQSVAQQWVAPDMANVEIVFTEADADIRIAFVQGDGSWSTIGTYCQEVPSGEATMNYGWLTPDSPDDGFRRVVLHEFGHALGLIHEHQNPRHAIAWNRTAVIADLSGPPNNWDLATIENNIFKKYDLTDVTGTDVDADSIMMYPIPASWTTDGFSADLNEDLSETDRNFIRSSYPR